MKTSTLILALLFCTAAHAKPNKESFLERRYLVCDAVDTRWRDLIAYSPDQKKYEQSGKVTEEWSALRHKVFHIYHLYESDGTRIGPAKYYFPINSDSSLFASVELQAFAGIKMIVQILSADGRTLASDSDFCGDPCSKSLWVRNPNVELFQINCAINEMPEEQNNKPRTN